MRSLRDIIQHGPTHQEQRVMRLLLNKVFKMFMVNAPDPPMVRLELQKGSLCLLPDGEYQIKKAFYPKEPFMTLKKEGDDIYINGRKEDNSKTIFTHPSLVPTWVIELRYPEHKLTDALKPLVLV